MKIRILGTDRELKALYNLLENKPIVYRRDGISRVYFEVNKSIKCIEKLADILNKYER